MINLNEKDNPIVLQYLKNLDQNKFNDLEKFFYLKNHRLIHKWKNYFEIYDRHFSKFRNKEVTVVEIGVFKGGSLQMWKDYFGPKCRVIGIDIDPSCKELEEPQIEIMIGSQDDVNFLNKFKEKVPKIDILIDDGGHFMNQLKVTFENLFDHISEEGVYLCEDLHTSYWPYYGGSYKGIDSFIEYSKNFIDYINAWHSMQPELVANDFTRSAHSLHYYDSVLVIEKRRMYMPLDLYYENI